jgi:hypothetical protein
MNNTYLWKGEQENQLHYSLARRMHVVCRLNKQVAWRIQLWWHNHHAMTGVQGALAAQMVFNHIHYLDTSGTGMVNWDDASLKLHARQSIVIRDKENSSNPVRYERVFRGMFRYWEKSLP